MKTYYYHILFSLLLFLTACSTKVLVDTDKTDKPTSYISSIQRGQITTVSSKETVGKSVDVLEGEDVFFIARGYDSLGVNSLKVKVIQNGNMEIEGQLESEFSKTIPIDSDGRGPDNIYTSGKLRPDATSQPMIIRATAQDYANNTAISPALRVNYRKAAVARLSPNRYTINRGESIVLTYETENATRVKLNGVVLMTMNGLSTVSPTQNHQYILQANNSVSEASDTVNITVTQPSSIPIINSFYASPRNITQAQSITLNWNVSNANSVSISPGNFTSSNSSGSRNYNPANTTTYTITASGPGGTITGNELVTVNPPASQIVCNNTGPWPFRFDHVGDSETDGSSWYSMNLTDYAIYNNRVITSIKNKSNVQINLWTGGNVVTLNPNGSTTQFNGLNVARNWAIQTNQNIGSPLVEFCTDEL